MWLTGMARCERVFPDDDDDHFDSIGHYSERVFSFRFGADRFRFNCADAFATAFLPMFGIGGLTGIPLALTGADLYLHDTYT
jgi:hypothetical protein